MDTVDSIKILMLPWLAYGHVSPYLELAKKLSPYNIKVYLCSTPINLKPFKNNNSLASNFPLVELVDLHLPTTLLPPHYHTTRTLPLHLNNTLKAAFDEAKPGFSSLLKALKPDLVVVDFYQPWAVEAANHLDIRSVPFFTVSAWSIAFIAHFCICPSSDFPLRPSYYQQEHTMGVDRFFDEECGGMTNRYRILKVLFDSSDLMMVKTSREIEPKQVLDYLSALTNKEVVPVGTLIQWQDHDKDGANEYSYIEEWLNQRDPRSVVYVSFGSEYFLSKEEMGEVARGLELSMVNFIWVIRFAACGDGDQDKGKGMSMHEALPEGFLGRVEKTGLVLQGWAPQARILGHPSTGGFVSHCGWSSTLEGITFGVPILAMPCKYDQPDNALLIEQIGVGLEVPRRDGKIDGEEMARVIDEVIVHEGGRQVRERAMEYSRKLEASGELDLAVVKKLVQLACRSLNSDH